MNIVQAKRVPIYRPNSAVSEFLSGLDVSAIYDDVLLICPDDIVNDEPIELDLDAEAQQDVVHIVLGDDGQAHVEPYWPYPDKFPLPSWEFFTPGSCVINVGRLKTPSVGVFQNHDLYLPLWDFIKQKTPDEMTEEECYFFKAQKDRGTPFCNMLLEKRKKLLALPKEQMRSFDLEWLRVISLPDNCLSEAERITKYLPFFL